MQRRACTCLTCVLQTIKLFGTGLLSAWLLSAWLLSGNVSLGAGPVLARWAVDRQRVVRQIRQTVGRLQGHISGLIQGPRGSRVPGGLVF